MTIFLKNTLTPLGGDSFLSQLLGGISPAGTVDLALLQEVALQTSPQALLAEVNIGNEKIAPDIALSIPVEKGNVESDNTATSLYKPYTGSAPRSPDDETALAFDLAREFSPFDNVFINRFDSEVSLQGEGRLNSSDIPNVLRTEILLHPPIAVGDSYEINEDTTLIVPAAVAPIQNFRGFSPQARGPELPILAVLDNDSDEDGDPLSAILVDDVRNGSLAFNADGSFTYTPNENYHGTDSFTYKANDGVFDSNVVTVTLIVRPVNDGPDATSDAYDVNEDGTLVVAPVGILANDGDIEEDDLSAILVSNVSHGTLNLNEDGSFTYEPDENYHGPDSFTYKA
ncbi:MAG TPA: hypothetical protein DD412_04995, partial [Holosporales bacterium]|nr:hypothetical protein [Holosporales bacterium]